MDHLEYSLPVLSILLRPFFTLAFGWWRNQLVCYFACVRACWRAWVGGSVCVCGRFFSMMPALFVMPCRRAHHSLVKHLVAQFPNPVRRKNGHWKTPYQVAAAETFEARHGPVTATGHRWWNRLFSSIFLSLVYISAELDSRSA